ncbi:MAG TPA: gamma-glutamyl-gamma-aminobutyrate hydrolase family protein [Gemmatimonadaceae bacterium]|nr:gamma-glutamyl-gamma-aminobutyrate hydrolase family protein [Gemmatimonadaceae bacterium]
MPRPPLIAVTATIRPVEGAPRVRLNAAYLEAVERAGGLPVVVAPLASIAEVGRIIDAVDALLLTGGEDVDPARYDQPPHPTVDRVSPERDATEIALVLAAQRRALPTLAICRGIQLLNVALGGSLVQDIPSQRPGALAHDPEGPRDARVHEVQIEPGSRLATLLGARSLRVNSMHHQAVDEVADGLRATAWAADGLIEGVEWATPEWWLVGVQWHPEELTGKDEGVFRGLMEAVGA